MNAATLAALQPDDDLHALLRQVERRLTQLAQHEGDIALLHRLRLIVPPPAWPALTIAKGVRP